MADSWSPLLLLHESITIACYSTDAAGHSNGNKRSFASLTWSLRAIYFSGGFGLHGSRSSSIPSYHKSSKRRWIIDDVDSAVVVGCSTSHREMYVLGRVLRESQRINLERTNFWISPGVFHQSHLSPMVRLLMEGYYTGIFSSNIGSCLLHPRTFHDDSSNTRLTELNVPNECTVMRRESSMTSSVS